MPGIQILLVEDNPVDIMIMQEAFTELGLSSQLHAVNDGQEALEFLNRQGQFSGKPRPELILLDLNMPRMDGREFLRRVKQDARFHEIPIIVLTTSRSQDDIRTAYQLHCNCFVAKPQDYEQFQVLVRKLEEFWLRHALLPTANGRGEPTTRGEAPGP